MRSLFHENIARRRLFCGAVGLLALAAMPSGAARAYTHTILYSFCVMTSCTDGSTPHGGLTMDSTGALFGTAGGGGAHALGTVFKLTPNAHRTKWKLQTLYSFCAKANCADGEYPTGGLVLDTQGNLYGTTYQGGRSTNFGIAFELSPVAGKTKWKLTVLHDFVGGSDGSFPLTGLSYQGAQSGALYDGVSPLYGTTETGGSGSAIGTVFSIAPVAGKAAWKEKILHAFPMADGNLPFGGLIFDASGNLYGTAETGGSSTFAGTVFEMTPNTHQTNWTLTVLHNFCATFVCTDGQNPMASLAMDASGNIFGTTYIGGADSDGVAFKLVPDGTNSQETVLHDFCSQANCADGRNPGNGGSGPLAIDASDNLFGTAYFGGGNNIDMNGKGGGVVYELNGTQTVLYSFCAEANCTDGEYPSSGLLLDGSNDLIGTTAQGGANGKGTIYELTP